MLIQPLLDKLIQLRLPAFRDGLREQLNTLVLGPTEFWEDFSRFCSGFIYLPERLFGPLLPHLTPALPTDPLPPGWLLSRLARQPG